MVLTYSGLKEDFVSFCKPKVNDSILFHLKKDFEDELKSIRRLSYCNNLENLLLLLEKADILSENDVNPLKRIASILGESYVLLYIRLYENPRTDESQTVPPPQYSSLNTPRGPVFSKKRGAPMLNQNFRRVLTSVAKPTFYLIFLYALVDFIRSPTQPPTSLPVQPPANLVIPPVFVNGDAEDKVKTICFKIISDSLGEKWKDMGRALSIPEGEMDEIYRKYQENMNLQILEMLRRFEEKPQYERRTLRTSLEKALRKARRADLANQISDIFDRYS